MDEYEVGETYWFEGAPYVFKGGDPAKKRSWKAATVELPAARVTQRGTPSRDTSATPSRVRGLLDDTTPPRPAARDATAGRRVAGGAINPTSPADPRFDPKNDAENQAAHRRDWNESVPADTPGEGVDLAPARRAQAARSATERGIAQAATLGFADEAVGLVGGVRSALTGGGFRQGFSEARGAYNDRLATDNRDNKWAAIRGRILGSVVGPSVGIGAGRLVPTGSLSAPTAAAVRGATGFGAAGTVAGYGMAEGGPIERIPSALRTGAASAVVGGLFGPVAEAVPAIAGRAGRAVATARGRGTTNDQLAQTLARTSGVPGGQIQRAAQLAKAETRRVSDEVYKPLEEAHPIVDDPQILALVTNPKSPHASVMMDAVKTVMGPRRAQQEPPSLRQLQSIERRLRSLATKAGREGDPDMVARYRQAAGDLRGLMQTRIPGLSEANEAYRVAKAAEDAFQRGVRAWGRGAKINRPEQIRTMLESLPEGAARDNARAGMVATLFDALSTKGSTVTRAEIEALESIGMRARIKELFRSDVAYREFMSEIERTGKALADASRLKSTAEVAKWLAKWGLITGGVVGGSYVGARASGGLFGDQ